jgi:glutathione S-transferase
MSFIASTVHPARRRGEDHARGLSPGRAAAGGSDLAVGAYSIADIQLFRLFWRFRRSVGADPAMFPNLSRHYDRMMERRAVRKTMEDEAALGYCLPA